MDPPSPPKVPTTPLHPNLQIHTSHIFGTAGSQVGCESSAGSSIWIGSTQGKIFIARPSLHLLHAHAAPPLRKIEDTSSLHARLHRPYGMLLASLRSTP